MEMSRQRLRTGVLEASTKPCPHCDGTGLMRTAASAGLSALRILEDEAARGRGERITLRAGKEAAVYVLNKKRAELADIELRYGVMIDVQIDEGLEGARMSVDSAGPRPVAAPRPEAPVLQEELEDEMVETEDEEEETEERESAPEGEREGGRRRRRRRRGGRGRNRREGGEPIEDASEAIALEAGEEPEPIDEAQEAPAEEPREGGKRRRRRRGRGDASAGTAETRVDPDSSPMIERPIEDEPPIAETQPAEEPKPAASPLEGSKRRRSRKAAAAETEIVVPEPAPADAPPGETADEEKPAAKPRRGRGKKAVAAAETDTATTSEPAPPPPANNDTAEDSSGEPRRSGWWQRTFG